MEKHTTFLMIAKKVFVPNKAPLDKIQTLIAALEDAKFTNQDIYILYIDFKNAFGSIDHPRLLAIMTDLGYPEDVVTVIGNIYSQSTTTYVGGHFGKTHPIPIQRGTIQGDTLSHIYSLSFSNHFLDGYSLEKMDTPLEH